MLNNQPRPRGVDEIVFVGHTDGEREGRQDEGKDRVVQQFKKSIKRKSLTAADSDTSLTAGINI